MFQLLTGSVLLSLLHALIPNHWLPVLAIGRKENWNREEVSWVTFLCGLAHALSTILIGLILALLGWRMAADFAAATRIIAPATLILLGTYFLYQHHIHHHFHIHQQPDPSMSRTKVIALLTSTMFFSPCLEIEGYFLLAGTEGIGVTLLVGMIYLVLSIGGMVFWVRWAFSKSQKMNWHGLEHQAGMITGATLIATGLITFFVH